MSESDIIRIISNCKNAIRDFKKIKAAAENGTITESFITERMKLIRGSIKFLELYED